MCITSILIKQYITHCKQLKIYVNEQLCGFIQCTGRLDADSIASCTSMCSSFCKTSNDWMWMCVSIVRCGIRVFHKYTTLAIMPILASTALLLETETSSDKMLPPIGQHSPVWASLACATYGMFKLLFIHHLVFGFGYFVGIIDRDYMRNLKFQSSKQMFG